MDATIGKERWKSVVKLGEDSSKDKVSFVSLFFFFLPSLFLGREKIAGSSFQSIWFKRACRKDIAITKRFERRRKFSSSRLYSIPTVSFMVFDVSCFERSKVEA